MLYVTTREKYDAYTTARTLQSDFGPDGGLYFPYKMPRLTAAETAALKEKTFGQNVADMLNRFFSSSLSGWDVEFGIGRYPVRVAALHQKILIAECWRNLDGSYEAMERQLAGRVCGCFPAEAKLTSWLRIAIRIAVLAGIAGELQRQGIEGAVDISVPEGDFNQVMALWYAREIGLPIANIICGCADGSNAWELIHAGAVRGSGATLELERLVRGTLGVDEAQRFAAACGNADLYALLPHMAKQLRQGMFAAVVSRSRVDAAIPNVFSTASYIMEPDVAVAYSSLLDYRAKTGESRTALLMGQCNPNEIPRIKELLG